MVGTTIWLPQIQGNENELGNQVRLHNQNKLYPNFSGNLTKEKKLMKTIQLITKSIAGTKDNLNEMIVWTNCTLKQNRLMITRTLKRSGLEQVYICKKEWDNDYLINTIFASGRYSHSFTQYKGLSGWARVYDTSVFENTGEVIVFDGFKKSFGASANRWVSIANEITGYDAS